MAKNVTFAHVLFMGTLLKLSMKINILTCAVRSNPHEPGVSIPFPPRVLETVEDSVIEKSWSENQLTESSEYECDDDQQPKPFNQAELNDLVRDLTLPKS